jgi:Domain of unknown function (DUF4401)
MSAADGTDELIAALRARAVIAAGAATLPAEATDRPWFIALLQGMAGWLAGIFLLAFLAMIFKPDTTGGILLLGVLLLGSAWALYFADRNAVFLDQLALAISIAGQFAVTWGIVKNTNSGLPIAATLLGLQIVVFLVMPNKMARTLAALFACIAWAYSVRFLLLPGSGGEIFFNESRPRVLPMFGAWTEAIGWAIRWLPLLALASWLMARESEWMASGARIFARPALTGVLLALSAGILVADPLVELLLGTEAVGVPLNWSAVFPLASIGLALFSVGCAFRLRNLGLSGFAIFGALMQLARFYFLYGTTLLWKSAIMFCLGALLLAAGVALRRQAARGGSDA